MRNTILLFSFIFLGNLSILGYAQEYSSPKRDIRGTINSKNNITSAIAEKPESILRNRNEVSLDSDWAPNYTTKFGIADSPVEIEFGEFISDSQGNIFYTFTNGRAEFAKKAQTVKVDSEGNQLWIKEFSEFEYATGSNILVDENDDIIIGGAVIREDITNELYAIKYNNEGDKLWEVFINEDYFSTASCEKLMIDNDNNIFIIGRITNGSNGNYQSISKISNTGELLWSTYVQPENAIDYIDFNGAFLNLDNNLVVLSRVHDPINSEFFSYQAEVSQSGDIISTEQSLEYKLVLDFIHKEDFSYQTYKQNGNYILQKMDLDLSQIWSWEISPTASIGGSEIFVDDINNIYIYLKDGSNYQIIKLNSEGDEIFTQEYIPSEMVDYPIFNSIFSFENEKISIAGFCTIEDYTIRILVVELDNEGNTLSEELVSPNSDKPCTYSYDFALINNQILIGGLQYGLEPDNYWEQGRDLDVIALDDESNIQFRNTTEKGYNSNLFIWGSDMDDAENIYHAANSGGSYKVIKQSSDGTIAFESEYFLNYDNTGCADIVVATDGIVSGGFGYIGDELGLLLKTDFDGIEIWTRELEYFGMTGARIQYVKEDIEGNYLVASNIWTSDYVSRIMLSKYSPNGDLLWNYVNLNSAPSGSIVYNLEIAPNNDAIFSGVDYDQDFNQNMYAERINADGTQQWEYHNNISNGDLFSESVSDNQENTYLVGETGEQGFVFKINETGELVWDYFKEQGYMYSISMNQNNQNAIYCSGSFANGLILGATLLAIDTNGSIIWQQEKVLNNCTTHGLFVECDNDVVYQVGINYNDDNESSNSFITAHDLEGYLLNTFEKSFSIGFYNSSSIMDIIQNSNTVAYSMRSSISYYGGAHAIVNAFDKPIIESAIQYGSNSHIVSVYPNPTKDYLNLLSVEDISAIYIYDNNARICKSFHMLDKQTQINLNDLSKGFYIIEIHTPEDVLVEKLIIQ